MNNKFILFFDILFQQQDSEYCKVIVPVIPIRIANAGKTRRRRYAIGIAELYEDIGTSVGLEALRQLSSFKHFEEGVRNAFKQLNYLRN